MIDTNEIQAAVDRLRRVKAGEDIRNVYNSLLLTSARLLCNRDHETLADAYLELGTRQPDVYAVYLPPGVTMRDESLEAIRRDFPHLKGVVREVRFIQEIPEVPNAEK